MFSRNRLLVGSLAAFVILCLGVVVAGWWFTSRLDSNISTAATDDSWRNSVLPGYSLGLPPLWPALGSSNLEDDSLYISKTRESYGGSNYLLVGSDTRQGAFNKGFGQDVTGARSDVTILAHVSQDRSWAYLVAIPRDLYTTLPTSAKVCGGIGYNRSDRFNASLNNGLGCTVASAEALTGLKIDDAIMVDFKGFKDAVDAFGGFSVCLDQKVRDSDADLHLPAGRQILNGEQTLALARARKSLGNGSDLDRSARQQYIMKSFARQVQSLNLFADPARVYGVADAVTRSLTTTSGLNSVSSLVQLGFDLKDVSSIGSQMVPITGDTIINGMWVVGLDSSKADDLFDMLARDVNPKPQTSSVPGVLNKPKPKDSSGIFC